VVPLCQKRRKAGSCIGDRIGAADRHGRKAFSKGLRLEPVFQRRWVHPQKSRLE
jgi:hypothetical protein